MAEIYCKPIPELEYKDIEHFAEQVLVGEDDQCWPWKMSVDKSGYGQFYFQNAVKRGIGKGFKAHRVAFLIRHRCMPPGKMILHKCDNRLCCNPSHLYAGDMHDNHRDMTARGRRRATWIPGRPGMIGSQHPMSKLTEEKVLSIREKYATGGVTHLSLSKEYGVSEGCIQVVVEGKRWKHVVVPKQAADLPAEDQ